MIKLSVKLATNKALLSDKFSAALKFAAERGVISHLGGRAADNDESDESVMKFIPTIEFPSGQLRPLLATDVDALLAIYYKHQVAGQSSATSKEQAARLIELSVQMAATRGEGACASIGWPEEEEEEKEKEKPSRSVNAEGFLYPT